ncbi:hypothetical protein HYFRA_00013341 [Hymenoscyphus fraxineus]|uniref:Telomeric single stranded DNA binding POT1/Cdc13 domain-containing protein n=1 Tax=Hymenoscyphus fraxineus TaxID=746836 RepID=A0A9N9LBD2_9HELO|nr:hypothetical protein HYFRA_00013341 [Hymenoscyphus fraxineus]
MINLPEIAMESSNSALTLLDNTSHIPIAELSPSISEPSSKAIKAVVTLTWPYSSATGCVAYALSEPDFRLRRSRGQVRVQFAGSSAKRVAKSSIASGDEVVLCLDGVEWIKDDSTTVSTPGRGVEFELRFTERVLLKFRQEETHEFEIIDIDHPPPEAELPINSILPDAVPDFIPVPPVITNGTSTRDESLIDDGVYSSPAFVKRARTSYGSLFELDPFADEDGTVKGKGRKRTRLSSTWTYASRSPTPESEDSMEVEVENPPVETSKPVMQDEGCQTIGLEVDDAAESLANFAQQAVNAGGISYAGLQPVLGNGFNPINLNENHIQAPLIQRDFAEQNGNSADDNLSIPQSPKLMPLSSDSLPLVSPLISRGFSMNSFQPTPTISDLSQTPIMQPPIQADFSNENENEDLYGASPVAKRRESAGPPGFGTNIPEVNMLDPSHAEEGFIDRALSSQQSAVVSPHSHLPSDAPEDSMEIPDDDAFGIAEHQHGQFDLADLQHDSAPVHSLTAYPDLDGLSQQIPAWASVPKPMGYPDLPGPMEADPSIDHQERHQSTAMSRSQSARSQQSQVVDLTESDGEHDAHGEIDADNESLEDSDDQFEEDLEDPMAPRYYEGDPNVDEGSLGEGEMTENEYTEDEEGRLVRRYPDENGEELEDEEFSEIGSDDDQHPSGVSRISYPQGYVEEEYDEEEEGGYEDDDESMEDEEPAPPSAPIFIDLLSSDDEDEAPPEQKPTVTPQHIEPITNDDEAEEESESDIGLVDNENESDADSQSSDKNGVIQGEVEEMIDDVEQESEESESDTEIPGGDGVLQPISEPSDKHEDARETAQEVIEEVEQEPGLKVVIKVEHISAEIETKSPDKLPTVEVVIEQAGEDIGKESDPAVEIPGEELSTNPETKFSMGLEASRAQMDVSKDAEQDSKSALDVESEPDPEQMDLDGPDTIEAEIQEGDENTDPESSSESGRIKTVLGDIQEISEDAEQVSASGSDVDEAESEPEEMDLVPTTTFNENPHDINTEYGAIPHKAGGVDMDVGEVEMDEEYQSDEAADEQLQAESEVQNDQTVMEEVQAEDEVLEDDQTAEIKMTDEAELKENDNIQSLEESNEQVSDVEPMEIAEGDVQEESRAPSQEMEEESSSRPASTAGDNEADAMEVQEDSREVSEETEERPQSEGASSADQDEVDIQESLLREVSEEVMENPDSEAASAAGETDLVDIQEEDEEVEEFVGNMDAEKAASQDADQDADEKDVANITSELDDNGDIVDKNTTIEQYAASPRTRKQKEISRTTRPFGSDGSHDISPKRTRRGRKNAQLSTPDDTQISPTVASADVSFTDSHESQSPRKSKSTTELLPSLDMDEALLDESTVIEKRVQEAEAAAMDEVTLTNESTLIEKIVEEAKAAALEDIAQSPPKDEEPKKSTPKKLAGKTRSKALPEPETTPVPPRRSNRRARSASQSVLPETPTKSVGNEPPSTPIEESTAMSVVDQQFSPMKGHDASVELALSSLESPSKQPNPLASPVAQLKLELQHLRTDYGEFTSLKVLRHHQNAKLDVLAIVTTNSPEPKRLKNRSSQVTFNITDPSTAPNGVTEVQVFRQYKDALPVVKAGDGILLRNFKVAPGKNRNVLLSADQNNNTASWAVFKGDEDEPPEMRGPEVEFGDEEKKYVAKLKQWYADLEGNDASAKAKLERANAALDKNSSPAGKSVRR